MIYTDIIIATKKLARERRVDAHFVDTTTNEEEFKENIRFFDTELDWVKPNWDAEQPITWADVLSIHDEVATQNKLNICKEQAKKLLAESDWAVLPDAAAALNNQNDWVMYRAYLRGLLTTPVADHVFQSPPTVHWNI
jgi:hypothetical protein